MSTIKYKGSDCHIYNDILHFGTLANVRSVNGCTGFYFYSNYTSEDRRQEKKQNEKYAKQLEYTEAVKILSKKS